MRAGTGPAGGAAGAGDGRRKGGLPSFPLPASFFLTQEFEEVDGGQVARGVIDVHVLGAGVGGGDGPRVGAGVPAVDGGVVLHAGVGALPGRPGDVPHQVAGVVLLADLAGHHVAGVPLAALQDGLHEVVGDADGVVGVR